MTKSEAVDALVDLMCRGWVAFGHTGNYEEKDIANNCAGYIRQLKKSGFSKFDIADIMMQANQRIAGWDDADARKHWANKKTPPE